MRLSLALSIVPLAASVAALSVTEPKKGAEIDASSSFDVKWSSVDTDPSSFDIYLVNNAVYPTVQKRIATGIDTSKGSYHVDGVSGISAGHGYQIDLMSDSTENTGILAQSQQFNVTGSTQSSSSTSTTSASSTTLSGTKSTSSTTGNTLSTTTTAGTASSSSTATKSDTSSISSTGSAASGTASSTDAPNAGAAIMAHPVAALGVIGGALALAL